jgi:hypothetical protein
MLDRADAQPAARELFDQLDHQRGLAVVLSADNVDAAHGVVVPQTPRLLLATEE